MFRYICFIELVFPFNGKIEPKKINLVLTNQQQTGTIRLSYPGQLEPDEIQSLDLFRISKFGFRAY
jgi:hypothetical protein